MLGIEPEGFYWLLAVNRVAQHSIHDWRGVVGLQQQAALIAFQVYWLVLISCQTMQSHSVIALSILMQQACGSVCTSKPVQCAFLSSKLVAEAISKGGTKVKHLLHSKISKECTANG